MGINPMALRVDPLILHVDGLIKQASKKASDAMEGLSAAHLDSEYEKHILALGGVVNKEKIEEERQNIKEGKPTHSTYVTSTYPKTKNLIEKSDTLIKLATNRGIGKGTIVQHLAQIKAEDPSINIEKYKPKDELFSKVDDAVLKLMTKKIKENFSEDGQLRLKPVYEALGGEVSYDDIRVCMLFID
jgi:uncharacterized protein YpbB